MQEGRVGKKIRGDNPSLLEFVELIRRLHLNTQFQTQITVIMMFLLANNDKNYNDAPFDHSFTQVPFILKSETYPGLHLRQMYKEL